MGARPGLGLILSSLTTASGSRLFGSVVESWIIDPVARVRFPLKSWEFFSAKFAMLCSLLGLLCRKMGARPGSDLILSRNGLILRRNGFQAIINDDFLEEGECYGR